MSSGLVGKGVGLADVDDDEVSRSRHRHSRFDLLDRCRSWGRSQRSKALPW